MFAGYLIILHYEDITAQAMTNYVVSGGRRVPKFYIRVEAYGSVDE